MKKFLLRLWIRLNILNPFAADMALCFWHLEPESCDPCYRRYRRKMEARSNKRFADRQKWQSLADEVRNV